MTGPTIDGDPEVATVPPGGQGFAARLARLARLDLEVFDDVRDDPSALIPSIVVLVGGLATLGAGGWLWWLLSGLGDARGVLFRSVVLGTAFGVALWLAWLLVAFTVLQRVAEAPRVDSMLRTAGFAGGGLGLGVLMVVPPVAFGAGLLALAAWVQLTQVALERATGASRQAVLLANLAGFAVWVAGMSILATADNQLAPGPFLAESIWEAVSGFDAARAVIGG
ncbi:MAG: hypothetical protein R3C39_02065 [Dehalococcoidia bacterium]